MPNQRRASAIAACSGLTLIAGFLVPAASAAEEQDLIFAAAYLGATEIGNTSLPSEVDGQVVTWNVDDDSFAAPYSNVEIGGVTADDQEVVAKVEVVAPAENPLVYFVDAGHGGDSQSLPYSSWETNSDAFNSVKTLSFETLRNDKADQFADTDKSWGFLHGGANNLKISVLGGDPPAAITRDQLGAFNKWDLGTRTNGTEVRYRLDLEPGDYTLTSGFQEFYGAGRVRDIAPVISFEKDGQTDSITLPTFRPDTSSSPNPWQISQLFTIPDGAENLNLTYSQKGGEAPYLNWFAVAKGDAKTAIDDAIAKNPRTINVTIDADAIKADNINGLTFKGFGTLSANSTSAVLMDYKSEQPEKYLELLEVLFGGENPIMNQVKIEMGNDRNTSTGPNPGTKRWEDEPANVARDPGFQLAADAIAFNPDLEVSILRWVAPAWANNNDKIYKWYKEAILSAYRTYGYMVSYVNPDINERAANQTWIKDFANRVRNESEGFESDTEKELFNQIKVIISDETGIASCGNAMINDAALRDAVDVVGYHYNTNDDSNGNFKRLAISYDKEIWNSEAQATFSNSTFRPNNNTADPSVAGTGLGGTGSALEMGNTVIKGMVNSHRTHFIYQPGIGSFFEGGQYSFKELVSARDPWSGFIHYDAGLAITQHFASFSKTGWENDDNSNGIWRLIPEASATSAAGTNPVNGRNGGPNYVTLAAPDKSDFSTVIANDSEYELTYRLTPKNFKLDANASLDVWETRAADDGQVPDANYKKQVMHDVQKRADGSYQVTVKPYSMVTVTTLDSEDLDESWHSPLPKDTNRDVLDVSPNTGVLWEDSFDYSKKTVPTFTDGKISGTESFVDSRGGKAGAIPLYSWDRNGAFEAVINEVGEAVLRQQADQEQAGIGGAWNGGDPITAIGDRRWVNYKASVDTQFVRDTNTNNYASLGVRVSGGDNSQNINSAPYTIRLQANGKWTFNRLGTVITQGAVDGWDRTAWHRLSLQAAGDKITGWIDNKEVFAWTDEAPIRSGWVDLASGFHYTDFDNLAVERVPGFAPYYDNYLDNLEMHTANSTAEIALEYGGTWRHVNGEGMYVYHRSLSSTSTAGASVSYNFTGTGLDLIGQNNGSADLAVSLDGKLLSPRESSQASGQFGQTFALRGLPNEKHRVTFTLLSGSLNVDAVGIVRETPTTPASIEELSTSLEAAEAVERTDDFDDEAWNALQLNITHGKAAVADPAGFGLDFEGAKQLQDRLIAASSPILARIRSVENVSIATTTGTVPSLPEVVIVTLDDDSTREMNVKWNLDSASFKKAWETVRVSGSIASLPVSATVEVIPRNVIAFSDINATESELGFPSPAYQSISGLDGVNLINDSVHQIYNGSNNWGVWGKRANGNNALNPKGVVDGPYNKLTTTGAYSQDEVGAQLGFTIDLPAGNYHFVAGSHSWWAGNSRSATASLTHDGTTEVVEEDVTLNSTTPSRILDYPVTLENDGPLTFTLTAKNGQSPMLSWIGIVKVPSAPEVVTGTRCVAGKVTVYATVTNTSDASQTITVSSAYGTKTIEVAAGKSDSVAFSTRTTSVDASEVKVTVKTEEGENLIVETPIQKATCS